MARAQIHLVESLLPGSLARLSVRDLPLHACLILSHNKENTAGTGLLPAVMESVRQLGSAEAHCLSCLRRKSLAIAPKAGTLALQPLDGGMAGVVVMV